MDLPRSSVKSSLSCRALARGAGALAAALLVACPGGNVSARTRVVLLGTSGGPTWWPNSDRKGTASALVVSDPTNPSVDHIYLVDLGPGSTERLGEAFNSGTFTNVDGNLVQVGYSSFLSKVRALFFTHLHMDHTADFPALLLCGQGAGLMAYPDSESDKRLQVYGPGTRGQLEDAYPPGRTNVPPTMNPDNPTPGTVDMIQSLLQAYAQTINNFTLESGWSDFSKLVSVHDIPLLPLPRSDYPLDPATGQSRNEAPWPDMEPILVYRDSRVSVTAVLVNHFSVYPNFAFRFDTADGAVVFSGDTGYPCTNLVRLAQGAAILVHEVIDPAFIDNLFPPPLSPAAQAMKYHLETAHTSISDVGKHATAAGVGALVLNHIVPGNTAEDRLRLAQQNFAGRLIVGSDLAQIDVVSPSNGFSAVAADFDGDAKADPAIVISGSWQAWFSRYNYARVGPYAFTQTNWTPLACDFDGDRLADPSGMDASGNWYIRYSAAGYLLGGYYPLGLGSCAPIAGDVDGDAYADTGSLDGFGQWYFWLSTYRYLRGGPYAFGGAGMTPHAADFDGDRLADPAADDGAGNWYVRYSSVGYQPGGPYPAGAAGLATVAADFDGDSLADTAGTDGAGAWYFWLSGSGYRMLGPVTFFLQ